MRMTNTVAALSDTLMYSAIVVYALAMLAYAAAAAVRRQSMATLAAPVPALATGRGEDGVETASSAARITTPATSAAWRVGRVAVSLTILAFALHAAAVVTRGLAAGRAPWGNMYEFATAGALAATGAYLLFLRRQPIRDLGVWVIALVTLSLGLGVTVLYTPAGDLVPALNSYWLVIHVAAAITAGGVFTVGAVATGLYLVRRRGRRAAEDHSTGAGYASRLPGAETLDRVAHTAHLFAFPIWTFAVIAGAIWAEDSWGRYWGWDPKETWAFITWVLYAAHLHARATAGWRASRAAWFAVAGYAAFLFNFFGVNMWITGLHSYAGI